MKEILDLFGIAWPKLVAQILLFLIVYSILKKYAFGPVTEMLEKRRLRIAEMEENLEKSRGDLENAEAQASAVISEANAKAESIVLEARENVERESEKKREQATLEAVNIISKSRDAAAQERDQVMVGLKNEFGRMVAGATSAVTGKVLTDSDHQAINQDAASHLN